MKLYNRWKFAPKIGHYSSREEKYSKKEPFQKSEIIPIAKQDRSIREGALHYSTFDTLKQCGTGESTLSRVYSQNSHTIVCTEVQCTLHCKQYECTFNTITLLPQEE